ncbi:hypothetical protein E4K10_40720 [Streptomyces sp. T1317-0309]|nr:hypothetical protein E4K10_40720 [Streptomyces sp. T1317-0309]
MSPGVQYRESATVTGETRVIAADKHYGTGSRTAENWFSPIQRPRISYDGTSLSRQDDALFAFVAGWGDAGADREGYGTAPGVQAKTSIYQGDTLLAQSSDYYTYTAGLKPEALPYRIVSEFSAAPGRAPIPPAPVRSGTSRPRPAGVTRTCRCPWSNSTTTSRPTSRARPAATRSSPSSPPSRPVNGRRLTRTCPRRLPQRDPGAVLRRRRHLAQGTSDPDVRRPWLAYGAERPQGCPLRHRPAGAADSDGNAVEQTIVRAFGLR